MKRNWIGPLALLTAAMIWGFVPTSTRYVVQTLSPGHILLARFLVGAVAASLLIVVFHAPTPTRPLLRRAVGLGLLGQFGFNIPLAYGIQHVEAGTVALISGTSPIFMAVLAVPLLHEQLRARVVAGLLLALGGTVIVVLVSGREISISADQAWGSFLILLSAVLWAIYSVVVKPWLGPIPPSSIPMIGSIAGLPLIAPLGAPGFVGALGDLEWVGWLGVAHFTLAASVAAPILWAVGLQRGEAGRSGMYLYLVPLFGVVASTVLLDEPVGVGVVGGGGLILAGVLLATLPRPRRAGGRVIPAASD